jgi:hypothetical protein
MSPETIALMRFRQEIGPPDQFLLLPTAIVVLRAVPGA